MGIVGTAAFCSLAVRCLSHYWRRVTPPAIVTGVQPYYIAEWAQLAYSEFFGIMGVVLTHC
jgi:hypothetical protein